MGYAQPRSQPRFMAQRLPRQVAIPTMPPPGTIKPVGRPATWPTMPRPANDNIPRLPRVKGAIRLPGGLARWLGPLGLVISITEYLDGLMWPKPATPANWDGSAGNWTRCTNPTQACYDQYGHTKLAWTTTLSSPTCTAFGTCPQGSMTWNADAGATVPGDPVTQLRFIRHSSNTPNYGWVTSRFIRPRNTSQGPAPEPVFHPATSAGTVAFPMELPRLPEFYPELAPLDLPLLRPVPVPRPLPVKPGSMPVRERPGKEVDPARRTSPGEQTERGPVGARAPQARRVPTINLSLREFPKSLTQSNKARKFNGTRPPRKREKEEKWSAKVKGSAIAKLFGLATEAADLVDAIHEALPVSCKHSKSVYGKVADIVKCNRPVDPNKVIENIILNKIQDEVVGKSMRKLNQVMVGAGLNPIQKPNPALGAGRQIPDLNL